jgi:hypothetical protein
MSYSSEKTKGQALRRIKSDEKKLLSSLNSIEGIDISALMGMNEADLSRLMDVLPKIQKFNDRLQLAKSKGLEYKREQIPPPINAKLLDRLKTKYSISTQISMKSTHTKENFKKDLVKRCANSLIGYDSCVNNTLDAFYDSIKIDVPVIEPIKKTKPKKVIDTESVFNHILSCAENI